MIPAPERLLYANIIGTTGIRYAIQSIAMAAESTDYATTVDARAIDGEPFSDIMAAINGLSETETVLLINSFEPKPLYPVLTRKDYDYDTTQVGDDEWHVAISHA